MTLHKNSDLFSIVIRGTAQHLNMSEQMVEKDYWVTLMLAQLARSSVSDYVVFKGGTSLSKAYNIIHRFSEDIDIAIIKDDCVSGNQIKERIRLISHIATSGFGEVNGVGDKTAVKASRFRKTFHSYPKIYNIANTQLNPNIVLEVNSFSEPLLFEKRHINSLCAGVLEELGQNQIITEYGLESFEINVLDKRKTLCEKVASLIRCSYGSEWKPELRSRVRHFYDIYFLLKDDECADYVKNELYDDLLSTIKYDKTWVKYPPNYKAMEISEAPLLNQFSAIWKELETTYTTNLSVIAYGAIPSSSDIIRAFMVINSAIKRGIKGHFITENPGTNSKHSGIDPDRPVKSITIPESGNKKKRRGL